MVVMKVLKQIKLWKWIDNLKLKSALHIYFLNDDVGRAET